MLILRAYQFYYRMKSEKPYVFKAIVIISIFVLLESIAISVSAVVGSVDQAAVIQLIFSAALGTRICKSIQYLDSFSPNHFSALAASSVVALPILGLLLIVVLIPSLATSILSAWSNITYKSAVVYVIDVLIDIISVFGTARVILWSSSKARAVHGP